MIAREGQTWSPGQSWVKPPNSLVGLLDSGRNTENANRIWEK